MTYLPMKLKPWTTPNFATVELPPRPKQDGVVALPAIPLADLTEEAVDDLVKQWRAEVYKKANMLLPEERP